MKCFKKVEFASTSDPDSAMDDNEKELSVLLTHLDSNFRVKDYVKTDKDLSIEKDGLNISTFMTEDTDTNEQFAYNDENDFSENENNNCKVKDFLEALRYNEELKSSFCVKGIPRALQK